MMSLRVITRDRDFASGVDADLFVKKMEIVVKPSGYLLQENLNLQHNSFPKCSI